MPTNTLTDLQGQIERVTYTNDENGYTVAKIKVYGRRDLVTIIGNIINPTPGEVIQIEGGVGRDR
jgi:exodeoxyribonuclease V alpha subunit